MKKIIVSCLFMAGIILSAIGQQTSNGQQNSGGEDNSNAGKISNLEVSKVFIPEEKSPGEDYTGAGEVDESGLGIRFTSNVPANALQAVSVSVGKEEGGDEIYNQTFLIKGADRGRAYPAGAMKGSKVRDNEIALLVPYKEAMPGNYVTVYIRTTGEGRSEKISTLYK